MTSRANSDWYTNNIFGSILFLPLLGDTMQEKFSILNNGQIFKTYNDMCEYLGEEICTGKSRQLQMKEWERFIKFKIRKNKSIIIEEVYEMPLIKVDKRSVGNNAVYSNLVQLILLDKLAKSAQNNQNYVNLSKADLYVLLGFTSDMYVAEFMHPYKQDAVHKEMVKNWKEENNLSDFDMRSFYQISSMKYNSIINPAIENLKKKFIIETQENYMLKEFADTEKNNEWKTYILQLNKDENITKGRLDKLCQRFEETEVRFATQEELSIIIELQREAMDRIDMDEFSWENRHRLPEYYKEFLIVLLENTNWCLCYKTNTFFFTESTIKSGISILEKRIEDVKAKRKKLNQLTKKAIDKRAVEAYNKNQDTLLERILEDPNAFSFKDNYVEAQRIINDFFSKIKEEIEEETKTKK